MAEKKKPNPGCVADAIREEIAKIPAHELAKAKPGRILPILEEAGYEITNSVRSATSKLLLQAKAEGEIVTFDSILEGHGLTERRELAMRLVEACCGDFDLVRAEIARLEEFAKRIKGA